MAQGALEKRISQPLCGGRSRYGLPKAGLNPHSSPGPRASPPHRTAVVSCHADFRGHWGPCLRPVRAASLPGCTGFLRGTFGRQ